MSARGSSAHGRFAEFPPETMSRATPNVVSIEVARAESSAMLASPGMTPFWQARFVPIPRRARPGRSSTDAHDVGEGVGHDALAEVSQFHHEDDAVALPLAVGRLRQALDDVDLTVETDVGARHHAIGLAEHG